MTPSGDGDPGGITADIPLRLAVDLGGTYTKFGHVAENGTLIDSAQVRTPVELGPRRLVEWLARLLVESAATTSVEHFGVAVPGIVDEVDGTVVNAPNVGWRGVRLAEHLRHLSGLQGVITHDVRAGTKAESRCGAGTGVGNLMFVPIGTGIAAGVVVDGTLLVAGGYAGELGHLPVPAAGDRRCVCGQAGCLETIASGPSMRRRYAERVGVEPAEAPSPEELAALARRGDSTSVEVIETAALGLGQALAVASTLYGTERVVLGGGVSGMFDLLVGPVTEHLATVLTFQRRPEIVLAQLGAQAGVVGAGLAAWAG